MAREAAPIHAALSRGPNLTEISGFLQLDRATVRRYADAADPAELLAGTPVRRRGLLDPHLPYLRQRWDEGCRSADRLNEEIRACGYRGSLRTLRHHTARLRQATTRPAPPPAPGAKTVASWILTPPGSLADDDRAALARITARCEEIAEIRAGLRVRRHALQPHRPKAPRLDRPGRRQPRPGATCLRRRPA